MAGLSGPKVLLFSSCLVSSPPAPREHKSLWFGQPFPVAQSPEFPQGETAIPGKKCCCGSEPWLHLPSQLCFRVNVDVSKIVLVIQAERRRVWFPAKTRVLCSRRAVFGGLPNRQTICRKAARQLAAEAGSTVTHRTLGTRSSAASCSQHEDEWFGISATGILESTQLPAGRLVPAPGDCWDITDGFVPFAGVLPRSSGSWFASGVSAQRLPSWGIAWPKSPFCKGASLSGGAKAAGATPPAPGEPSKLERQEAEEAEGGSSEQ